MRKKYLLCPGWVLSATDGDRHYIGAGKLAQLYQLPRNAYCVLLPNEEYSRIHAGLIPLHPRQDGKYTHLIK